MPVYYVGTSGFSYPHWRGTFYPEKLPQARWLEYYTQHFPTVELNNSFYRLPTEQTFQGWQRRSPQGFLFAVKVSRLITHLHRLRDVQGPLGTFLSRTQHLEERLGPLLYQLPPSMERDEELLDAFLASLPRWLHHAMEFRNTSWYQESVARVLRQHNVAFCIHDLARRESPAWVTADFTYIRFHGPTSRYVGSYPDVHLQEWADRIEGFGPGLHAVYVYFNNDIGGHAVHNARTLLHLLRQPSPSPLTGSGASAQRRTSSLSLPDAPAAMR